MPRESKTQTQAPPIVPPILTSTEASTLELIVSQQFIETQMRHLSKSITTSLGSMFEKLNQSVEYRFQNLSKEINQLKVRMDLYDLTISTPHDTQ